MPPDLPTRQKPRLVCLLRTPTFKAGDPPPRGYLAWHEWARIQDKAGLRQARCSSGYWHFPQERCSHAP